MEDTGVNLQATANETTQRWLLQTLVCVCFAGRGFLIVAFAVASATIVQYFQNAKTFEYEILSGFGCLFFLPGMIIVAGNGNRIQTRVLTITASSFLLAAAALSSIGFMSPYSFWSVVLGWTAGGMASGIIYVVPIALADTWFSSDFAIFSFSLAFSSFHLGSLASYATFRNMTNTYTNRITDLIDGKPFPVTQVFVDGFGVVTLILFATVMLLCLCSGNDFMTNEEARPDVDSTEPSLSTNCLANFESKRLLQPFNNVWIVLLMVTNFLVASTHVLYFLRMPDLLRRFHQSMDSGVITAVYITSMLGGIIGCCLAVGVSKRGFAPRSVSAASAAFTLCFCVGMYASFRARSFPGIAVCSVLFSTSASNLTISLLVVFLELLNPEMDRFNLTSWYFGFFNAGITIFNWLSIMFSYLGIPHAYCLLMICIMTCVLLLNAVAVYAGSSNKSSTNPSSPNETTSLMSRAED